MKNNLLNKLPFSILEGILDLDRDQLNEVARHISLKRGETVTRTDPPSEVFIVQRGLISLRSRTNSVHEYGRVKGGRSIELKSLFNQVKAWDFTWRAEEDTRLIALPWANVKSCLEKDKLSYEYLKRMTCGVEIQKLRRDLAAFGLEPDAIFEIISLLKFESAKKVLETQTADVVFAVVASGRINLSVDLDGGFREFCNFETGDHFIFESKNNRFKPDASSETKVWYINQSSWKKVKASKVFEYFLGAHHPLLYRDKLSDFEQTNITVTPKPSGVKLKRSSAWQEFKTSFRFFSTLFGISKSHIIQPDQSWSGATCIVIAAETHGYKVGINSVRNYFAGTEKSSQLENISRISKRLGFNPKIVLVSDVEFSTNKPLFIVHRSRTILLYGMSGGYAKVLDPELGEKSDVKLSRLRQQWDGRALRIEATAFTKDIPDPPVNFYRYLGIVRGSRYTFFLVGLAATLTFLFNLTIPMFNQYIFEHVLLEKRWEIAVGIMIGYATSVTFLSFFEWVIKYLECRISFVLEAKMTSAFMQHLIRLPMTFFDRFQKGDALERFEEAKQLGTFIGSELPRAAVNVLSVAICGMIMYFYHVRLFIAAISLLPVLFLVWVLLANRVHRIKTIVSYLQSRDRTLIVDAFDNIDLIKSNNGFRSERWKWEANSIKIKDSLRKLAVSDAIFSAVKELCEQGAKLWVLLIGVELYRTDQLTIGKVIASTFLIERFSGPLWALMQTLYNYSQIKASAQRLLPIFLTPAEKDDIRGDGRGQVIKGDLVFNNVSFAYGPEAPPTLENLNLVIKQGEIVAILGENGSGKSTLAALMNGSRTATTGTIHIGDHNILDISPHDLRKTVGVIPQESRLFKGTIFDNIVMGDVTATHEKVSDAIAAAEAQELIDRLPKGLDTQIGAGGLGISSGQSQKIILARLLFHGPSIFVLDESMSNLDPISQEQVINRFFSTVKGKTVIVITQHVGLLSRANKVILIQNRSVVALGSHQELIRHNRRYFDFFSRQLAANA